MPEINPDAYYKVTVIKPVKLSEFSTARPGDKVKVKGSVLETLPADRVEYELIAE
jgi:RNase P/RNase MRP subunit p29